MPICRIKKILSGANNTMINRIEITRKSKSIPASFGLNLDKLTVITGENNSGKTNFIKAIQGANVRFVDENTTEVIPKIIYIAAENIKPSDSETKPSNKTSGLIENLSELFSVIGTRFELTEKDTILSGVREVVRKTNENLAMFCGHSRHQVEVEVNDDELASDIILQALIMSITGKEDDQERKLDDLGQGTQRLIIASILKAYKDILVERQIQPDRPVLILFEEPEVYLHPKIKRTLNTVLEDISRQDGHQVILTTHDPYFAFQPFNGSDKKIVSFKRDGEDTELVEDEIYGIEDELLFIFLYSQLKDRGEDVTAIVIDGFVPRDYIQDDSTPTNRYSPLENIRHQIHHLGDNHYTDGLVAVAPTPTGRNWYTVEELANAISVMSRLLGR